MDATDCIIQALNRRRHRRVGNWRRDPQFPLHITSSAGMLPLDVAAEIAELYRRTRRDDEEDQHGQ